MDDKINSEIQPFLDLVASKQADYFSANGKYWQGLKTTNNVPDSKDDSSLIENLDSKPRIGIPSWREMGMDSLSLPFRAEVHEYQAPNGFGYQVVLMAGKDGKKYYYSKGYGVESDSRTWDWKEITETKWH